MKKFFAAALVVSMLTVLLSGLHVPGRRYDVSI